jgi:hypothetical protein
MCAGLQSIVSSACAEFRVHTRLPMPAATLSHTPQPPPHLPHNLTIALPCSRRAHAAAAAAAAAQQQHGTAGQFVPRKGAAGSPFVGGLSLKWNWIAVLKAPSKMVFFVSESTTDGL